MNFLVISYGTRFSGACLMINHEVQSVKMENALNSQLPNESIAQVLQESGVAAGQIDYLVFLGKPLAYFERIIDTHLRLFPGSFFGFFSDIRDFFSHNLRIKSNLRKSFNLRKDICYVEPADALVWAISKEFPGQDIAVLLSDALSLKVGGYYRNGEDGIYLAKELTRCVLRNSEDLLLPKSLPSRASKLLSLRTPRSGVKQPQNNGFGEEELYEKEIKELLSVEKSAGSDKIVLVCDYPLAQDLQSRLRRENKDLLLKFVKDNEILEYAGNYAREGVLKI